MTAAARGLTAAEAARARRALGRAPNPTELGVVAAMWSEHCSYKSSRKWLRTLPGEAPWVLRGPGDNAGAIDLGQGLAAVFKIESHNHPSFIEPRQGAATGVGGILRDVLAMGARPIALLDALRFGGPANPRTRHLAAGVVAGIGGYGNCVGVPTVGGETGFDPGYDDNILVNAMAVGLADADRLFHARAAGAGNPVVYLGARTGRDGVHGATMASAAFDGSSEDRRPTVQVGDPFAGKLLIEACLELMATDAVVAIQDLGAAGLASAAVEMAAGGAVGVELDLDRVPLREPDMTPLEILLSESQERMLAVIRPERVDAARAIFDRWRLDFAVIGEITGSGRLAARAGGGTAADLPLAPLAAEAPEYDRPRAALPAPGPAPELGRGAGRSPGALLKRLMASPDLASRRWIWEQYDHTVMADTVQRPGGDAAVVRIRGAGGGLALTTDCTPRYCAADPAAGGRQAVAEAWRNLTAVGARPLAITDNLNFGSPERPEVMAQFAGCVEGMAEACRALDFPVVSGNVSFYNETDGRAIPPTPVVGGVGLIDDLAEMTTAAFAAAGETILLIGDTQGHSGASLLARALGAGGGPPPPVDLAAERRNGDFVRGRIRAGAVSACHDVSDGGVLVALAEMALAGGVGADVSIPAGEERPLHWLFGEDQARYLATAADPEPVLAAARAAGVAAAAVGRTGGDALTVDRRGPISLAGLRSLHEGWLPGYMALS